MTHLISSPTFLILCWKKIKVPALSVFSPQNRICDYVRKRAFEKECMPNGRAVIIEFHTYRTASWESTRVESTGNAVNRFLRQRDCSCIAVNSVSCTTANFFSLWHYRVTQSVTFCITRRDRWEQFCRINFDGRQEYCALFNPASY